MYGSISSPSTPNNCTGGVGVGSGGGVGVGGCSSSSNNSINSGTYSATQATQSASNLSGTPPPQSERVGVGSGVPPAPPTTTTGSSGHKNSLKGTKLARRARSFKDDLIEKISLMRTTNNTLGRSHSPHSPRAKHGSAKPPPTTEEVQRSTQTLETHVKDISNALKHFRDVILKKKLEVLPGNGTVILETIASMYSVIQSYTLNENSAIMSSATQQVSQSLGKLIKLCDEVMLSEESGECASLSNENVREVIDLLEDAVRNLVTLAQGKLKEQDQCAFRYGGPGLGGIGAAAEIMGAVAASTAGSAACTSNSVANMRVSADAAAAAAVAQRTSLPDIALTPKERDILEQSNGNPMRGSHSTESILRDTSPPPKPPLPNRVSNPPPLPPKRRSQQSQQTGGGNSSSSTTASTSNQASPLPYTQSHNISLNSDLDCSSNFSLLNYGVDRLSVRSRSPDENSQCSFDSSLNHSRDEEDHQQHQQLLQQQQQQLLQMKSTAAKQSLHQLDDDVDKLISYKTTMDTKAMASMANAGATAAQMSGPLPAGGAAADTNTELRKAADILTSNRHSNESGFVSMMSLRTSTQSVSKRSSDQSVQSSTKSSSSNSEIAFGSSSSELTTTTTTATAAAAATTASSSEYQQINQRHTSTTTTTSSGSTTTTSTSTSYEHEQTNSSSSPELAPALPPKIQRTLTRHESGSLMMDEVDDSGAEIAELRQMSPHHHHRLHHHQQQHQQHHHQHNHHSSSSQLHQWHSKHHSLIEPPQNSHFASSCTAFDRHLAEEPPPLPMKKKHMFQSVAFSVLAYMEICSASTRSIEQHRHTMHACNISRNITHSQTMNIMQMSKELSPEMETPPALPPKNYKQRKPSMSTSTTTAVPATAMPTIITTPPPSPKPALGENGSGLRNSRMTTVSEELATEGEMPPHSTIVVDSNENVAGSGDSAVTVSGVGGNGQTFYCHSHQLPNETRGPNDDEDNEQPISTPKMLEDQQEGAPGDGRQAHEDEDEEEDEEEESEEPDEMLVNMLEEVDITPYLILKKKDEDGPEVKGGYIDALIVHASRVQKVADNGKHHQRRRNPHSHKHTHSHLFSIHSVRAAFSEAFITTFRTFIQPIDVIEKLTHRYTYFFCQVHDQKQKAAKETFSLLVRVVNDLTSTDLTSQLLILLAEFVYQLICSSQLYQAKLLHNKFVEKVNLYKEPKTYGFLNDTDHAAGMGFGTGFGTGGGGPTGNGCGSQISLLDLKSLDIAEQMTLLDAKLFQKIEIPEVLLFAKDQCEEKSPNLNKFTEHFNKMSYWARSKILRLQDAKEREKHVNKFIKIMKHLRKMNNYNSYLALLSALDSGPIRRLEWQKGIAEEVRSFCTLIDSSSSFRAYRQALAETNPPCIPYIGLVLQDLTFVHVGNQDYLSKGVINFSKRWQQYNIIVNMKRFKKCAYPFRRNERIIRFFENFKDFMGEEEMWQISEKIKPRGRRPVNY
ncbi:guanine nucleotide-releasing factor 2 isoform X5 [Drosophila willistoni]|uniref:guanine nucleotide-releasing factor 2 isoform X5 n=1 Tax=Drosophila willistoni TaxID=7260 RepID=UPI000C26CC1B|nr:guanine nucleotide-releasing factor 2 isoform X5 [Drosophila willistoni]